MRLLDWVKPNKRCTGSCLEEKSEKKQEDFDEEDLGDSKKYIKERLEEKKWIKVVFNIQLSNKTKFYKDINEIEEETGWDAKEDYDKLEKVGIVNFPVGGYFTTEEFLKLKGSLLRVKKKLSKGNKKPIWYMTGSGLCSGDKVLEGTKFYNLIEAFDTPNSLPHPLLSFNFFYERLQNLNKRNEKLVRKILGVDLKKIKLSKVKEKTDF